MLGEAVLPAATIPDWQGAAAGGAVAWLLLLLLH
jgi:hypothetical protein